MCAEIDVDWVLVWGQIWIKLGDMGFFSNRVFPTAGLGTEEGWKYTYPVHEVCGSPSSLPVLIFPQRPG